MHRVQKYRIFEEMKQAILKCTLVVFMIGAATQAARAQWQQVFGPTGGDVEAIASDAAGHVYAGTDSGVYMSSDNGTSWTQELNGLNNPEIFSFAITPDGTVLAGTEGGGIFRSTNFGASWDPSSSGLPDSSNILSLASDGHGNVYAGHSMHGVFYSSDDGLHWVARNAGMDSQTIFSLTVTPNGMVYAGGDRYIFSSSDEGAHWDTSLNTVYPGDEVLALAADSSGDVFAGTFLKQRFRLLAGSSAWEPFSPVVVNSGDEVRALACVGSHLFIGLFGNGIAQSGDEGSTWSDYSLGLTDPTVYSLTASPQGYLYAGTSHGEVFRAQLGLSVGEQIAAKSGLSVWPQPCNSVVHFTFSNTHQPVRLHLLDVNGREVQPVSREDIASGMLNTSLLANGVYRLVLELPDGFVSSAIIVQR